MARDLTVKSKIVDADQYVYRQERDLTKTEVDWNTVTKELTDTIEKVRDDRQTQKAEIETSTIESMGQLAEIEKYDSQSLNVKILEGSEWGSNFLASQNDLMKRGLIKPAAYMQSKQKVSDSFTQLKKALGTFDADYIEAQKRMNSKVPGEQSNAMEQWQMGELSGFANLGDYDFAGNPATGNMNFVKKGTDASKPENLLSLNTINGRLTQKSDYISLTKATEAEISTAGAQIKEVFSNAGGMGSVIGVEDFLDKEGAQGMLERMVGVVTANDQDKISIMQDLGVNSDMYTSDPEEAAANPGDGTAANPGMVLMVPTGDQQGTMKPEFSPEQIALIEKEAEVALKTQLDKKIQVLKGHQKTYAPLPTNATIAAKKERQEAADMYGVTVKLVTGNASEAEQAATSLAAHANAAIADPEMQIAPGGVQRMADGSLLITRVNKTTFPVPSVASDGTPRSPREMIDSVFKTLVPDLGNVATAGGEYINLGNVIGDTVGLDAVTSTGEIVKIEEIEADPVDIDSPYANLGSMTPYEYMDSKHGTAIGSASSWADVEKEYTKILNAVIPQDVATHFLEQGMRFVVVQRMDSDGNPTSTLDVEVQDSDGNYIPGLVVPIYNSDGDNDQVSDHIQSLSELANKARERYLKEANEEAQAQGGRRQLPQ